MKCLFGERQKDVAGCTSFEESGTNFQDPELSFVRLDAGADVIQVTDHDRDGSALATACLLFMS